MKLIASILGWMAMVVLFYAGFAAWASSFSNGL